MERMVPQPNNQRPFRVNSERSVALAANDRYAPGIYCCVASLLMHSNQDVSYRFYVLDGGIEPTSKIQIERMVQRFSKKSCITFLDLSTDVFSGFPLGPKESLMNYARLLLPELVPGADRLLYLDADILCFRDVAPLFETTIPPGKWLAAVEDAETRSLRQDSPNVAAALGCENASGYFNSGVLLMDLDGLRRAKFTDRALTFLQKHGQDCRFWDQSAINFLLVDQIAPLPEYWNLASWQFDLQQDNHLDCILHYTTSAPWILPRLGPAQSLFEQFALAVDAPVSWDATTVKRAHRKWQQQCLLAPIRAAAFPLLSLMNHALGRHDRGRSYRTVARYWWEYLKDLPSRRRLHRRRIEEVRTKTFALPAGDPQP